MRVIIVLLAVVFFAGCTEPSTVDGATMVKGASYAVSNSDETLNLTWEIEGGFLRVKINHGPMEAEQIIDRNGRAIEERNGLEDGVWGSIYFPHGPAAYAPPSMVFVPGKTVSLPEPLLARTNLIGLSLHAEASGLTVEQNQGEQVIGYTCQRDCPFLNGEVLQPEFTISPGEFFPEKITFPNDELTLTLIHGARPPLEGLEIFSGWSTLEPSCVNYCKTGSWKNGVDLAQAYDFLTGTDPTHPDPTTGFVLAMADDEGVGAWYHAMMHDSQHYTQQALLVGAGGNSAPVLLPTITSGVDSQYGEAQARVPFDEVWGTAKINGTITSIASLNIEEQQNPNHYYSQKYRFDYTNGDGDFHFFAAEQNGWPLRISKSMVFF